MSMYPSPYSKSTSPSQAIEESKKKTSLLQDNSWIRRRGDEDEPVDRDPNFGRSILSRNKSNENIASSQPEEVKPTKPLSKSSSVQALSKRFSGSQDELSSSTLPSTKTSSYTRRSTTPAVEEQQASTKTSTVIRNGGTTETTVTTTQTLRSPVTKSPKTETFSERVLASSKGSQFSAYSPTRTTKITETTVSSPKEAENKPEEKLVSSSTKSNSSTTDSVEDKLYDTLLPKALKSDVPDSKTTGTSSETATVKSTPDQSKTTVTTTETVTVKSSPDGVKTTTTTKTSSTPEDDLYATLLPKSITSDSSSSTSSSITKREIVTVETSRGGESPTVTSPSSTRTNSYSSYADAVPSSRSSSSSNNYSSDRKSYSYSRPDSSYEYGSLGSPTSFSSTSYRSSRSDDALLDPLYSKSSVKSVYASSERPLLEKDLCSYCHKPFTGDAKMVLEDMKINCHASCFKCNVCDGTLGDLKAGDTMWIYKRVVHCESCFEVTREKWRR